MAPAKIKSPIKEQHLAEDLGYVEKADRRSGQPFNPPKIQKDETRCVVDGCFEKKAPGQTHVCSNHVRSN